MTNEEIDAVLTSNGWTEDKSVTQSRINADATGKEAWKHHSLIAGYLIMDIGQSIKTANLNANGYMQSVYMRNTKGPLAP